MEPARCLPGRAEPFRFPSPNRLQQQQLLTEVEAAEATHGLIEQLQSQLSSTMVGSPRSMAMIAGKLYELDPNAATPPEVQVEYQGRNYSFELVEIGPGHVVVQRQGERHRLDTPSREGSGRIVLKTAGP